jgi:integrase
LYLLAPVALVKRCRHERPFWKKCGCAWVADLYVEGRRRFVNLGHDHARAKVAYAQLLADRVAGRLRELPAGGSVAEVAERWMAGVESERGHDRPQTVDTYRWSLARSLAYFGPGDVASITPAHLDRFRAALARELAPRTVARIMTVLGLVLRHAVEEGRLADVPRATKRHRAEGAEGPRLTFDEAGAVIAQLRGPYRDAAELILWTGLRIGEVLALTAGDVDLERGILRVTRSARPDGTLGPPKTRTSRRTVALPEAALQLLLGRLGVGPRLFPGRRAVYDYHWKRAKDRAGVDVPGAGYHALRHVHAALLDAAGVSMRGAMARLGHSRLTQSLQYGWAAEAGSAPAVEAAWARLSGRPTRGTPPGGPDAPAGLEPPA